MVEVTCVIKDKQGDFVKVRGKERIGVQYVKERTWSAGWICNMITDDHINTTHSFYVKVPEENGYVIISCHEKNKKLCLVADSGNANLLELLPTCH